MELYDWAGRIVRFSSIASAKSDGSAVVSGRTFAGGAPRVQCSQRQHVVGAIASAAAHGDRRGTGCEPRLVQHDRFDVTR